jgi:hypothetical protein
MGETAQPRHVRRRAAAAEALRRSRLAPPVPDRTPSRPTPYVFATPQVFQPPPLASRIRYAEPEVRPFEGPTRRPPPPGWVWIEPPTWARKAPVRVGGYVDRGTKINSVSAAASTFTCAAINSTAGDLACGIISCEDPTATATYVKSITTGNTATLLGPYDQNGIVRAYFWYYVGITGNASDVWEGKWSKSVDGEITGTTIGGVGGYVTINHNGGNSGTAHTSGNISTTNPYALLVALDVVDNTATYVYGKSFEAAAGPTGLVHHGFGFKLQDRTGTYGAAATCNVSGTWIQIVAEFSPDGSAQPKLWKQGFGAVAASTTSVSPAYPEALESGNLIVLVVTSKHANNPTTPTGFTLQAQVSDGSGTGADTGSVVHSLYTKVSVGTEAGTETVSKTTETGTGIQARMFRIVSSNGSSETYSLAVTSGTDATTGTGVSVTGAGDPGFAVDDMAFLSFGDVSDVGTSTWGLTVTATSAVFSTSILLANDATSQGDDMRSVSSISTVTAGPSSAAPTFTGTANGTAVNSHRGAGVFLRLRQASTTQAVTGTSVAEAATGGAAAVTATAAVAGTSVAEAPTGGAAAVTALASVAGTSVPEAPTGGAAAVTAVAAIVGPSVPEAPTGGAATLTPGAVDVAGGANAEAAQGGAGALTSLTTVAGGDVPVGPTGGAGTVAPGTAAIVGTDVPVAPQGGQAALTTQGQVSGGDVSETPAAGAAVATSTTPVAGTTVGEAAQGGAAAVTPGTAPIQGQAVAESATAGAATVETTGAAVELTPEQLDALRRVQSGRNARRLTRVNHRLPLSLARRPRRR